MNVKTNHDTSPFVLTFAFATTQRQTLQKQKREQANTRGQFIQTLQNQSDTTSDGQKGS